MSLSTILNNSRPNKYPLANVMQSLNQPQIIKNLVFVFTLFSASLFSIKRPMLLIIKHTLPPLKWIAKSPNSIKEPCYYLQSEKKICLARQFKLLRNHIQASKTRIFSPTTIDDIHWKQVVHKPNQHLTQPTAQNDWLTSLPIFVLTNPAAAALLHKGSLGAGNWIEGQGFGWLSQSCTVGWTSNSKINILLILFTQQVCQIVWKCDMSVGKRFLRDEELI